MRTIERLYQRAKSRPRPQRMGLIMPWGDKWYFSMLSTVNGKREKEEKGFDCKADAVEYAQGRMKDDETLNIVSFIDMDKKEVPFTTEDKRRAASVCG